MNQQNQQNQQGQAGRNQQSSTDRNGSQTGPGGPPDVHQSNDSAGGLPRSPGNSGPRSDNQGWKPGQSVQADSDPVHESNDVAGGLPKSPAGANRLAGDRKMDDDTGFSRQ
jgi:hypothetical protein